MTKIALFEKWQFFLHFFKIFIFFDLRGDKLPLKCYRNAWFDLFWYLDIPGHWKKSVSVPTDEYIWNYSPFSSENWSLKPQKKISVKKKYCPQFFKNQKSLLYTLSEIPLSTTCISGFFDLGKIKGVIFFLQEVFCCDFFFAESIVA